MIIAPAAPASAASPSTAPAAAPGIGIPGVPGVSVVPVVPPVQVAPGVTIAPQPPTPAKGPPGVQIYQPAPPGVPLPPAAPGAAAVPPAQVSPPAAAPVKPSVAEMSFVVGADVNPDVTGRPSPVIVRTYELKSATVFNASDFFAMFERDREILGADLVARDEWALMPGNNRQALKNLQRDTRYVGVVAAFRDVERARWRAATFVYPNQTTRMEIRLERNEVVIRLH